MLAAVWTFCLVSNCIENNLNLTLIILRILQAYLIIGVWILNNRMQKEKERNLPFNIHVKCHQSTVCQRKKDNAPINKMLAKPVGQSSFDRWPQTPSLQPSSHGCSFVWPWNNSSSFIFWNSQFLTQNHSPLCQFSPLSLWVAFALVPFYSPKSSTIQLCITNWIFIIPPLIFHRLHHA